MHIYSNCRQTQKKTKQRSWGLQNLKKKQKQTMKNKWKKHMETNQRKHWEKTLEQPKNIGKKQTILNKTENNKTLEKNQRSWGCRGSSQESQNMFLSNVFFFGVCFHFLGFLNGAFPLRVSLFSKGFMFSMCVFLMVLMVPSPKSINIFMLWRCHLHDANCWSKRLLMLISQASLVSIWNRSGVGTVLSGWEFVSDAQM